METKIDKVHFKYKFDQAYNTVLINGVHGGLSRGMITMNFFQERAPLPKTQTYKLNEDGTLDNDSMIQTPKPDEDTIDVLRFFETGITCDIATAIEIRDWLSDQIKLASQ